MSKLLLVILLSIILTNCSLDTKTNLWSKSKKIKKNDAPVIKEIFKKTEILQKEFNKDIKINLKGLYKKNSFIGNLTNNNGHLNFDGDLKNISKYKFSKIDYFKYTNPNLIFTQNGSIIFFDNKGTILKFDQKSKPLWKKNYYNKSEKKINPILFFGANERNIIVSDSLANLYTLNIDNGNLIWKKKNRSPFFSQIKIYNNNIFTVDFDNVLRCFSLENGNELWNFKTSKSFIKSQQSLSLIAKDNRIVFINNLGDLTAVNSKTGDLIWQTPTQPNSIYENAFSLENSEIILDDNIIYFSNNKNELYAIDFKTGAVRWKQNINSNLRATVVENLLFTISAEGFFIVLNKNNGNIVRITNVFDRINNKKNNIKPTGFIVAKNKIYLSLNNGKMIIINVVDGRSEEVIKIDGDKISRAYVLDNNMYVIRNNAILKIN